MHHEIDLSGLKDLHELTKPDMWPLAYGWWVLGGLLLTAILIGIISFILWHNRPVIYANRKIKKITLAEHDDITYIKKLSQLLRRVAIAADGRAAIAPLSDTKWQHFLQHRAPLILSESEAHLLAFAPYEQKVKQPIHKDLLMEHSILWVKKVLDTKKSS